MPHVCIGGKAHISIHAPRTGSDAWGFQRVTPTKKFQSTLPARGATFRGIDDVMNALFQSTLPARGATTMCAGRQLSL